MQNSIVKIWIADKFLGVGVLIANEFVITCAHVIDDYDVFDLNFPLLDHDLKKIKIPAKLYKSNSTTEVDLALLKIEYFDDRIPIYPARLSIKDIFTDQEFQSYGYPVDLSTGTTAKGIIGNKQDYDWIEITGTNSYGYFVERGFSGTGVYNLKGNIIYGIINASSKVKEKRLACFIPIKIILSVFPELNKILNSKENTLKLINKNIETVIVELDKTFLNNENYKNHIRIKYNTLDAKNLNLKKVFQKNLFDFIAAKEDELEESFFNFPSLIKAQNKRNDEKTTFINVLNNLPRLSTKFFGRSEKIKEIRSKLSTNDRTWLISIEGIGGMGKSSLALEVAHYYLSKSQLPNFKESFQAIIWVSAKEDELVANLVQKISIGDVNLKEILITMALILQREDIMLRNSIEEQKKAVYEILKETRTLLIIDNFETIKDISVIEFISNIPTPTKVIITARYRIINATYNIRLEGLDEVSTHELLDEVANSKHIKLSAKDKTLIYQNTTGVPLAMMWVIGCLSAGYSLNTTIKTLYKENEFTYFLFSKIIERIKTNDSFKCLMVFSYFDKQVNIEAIAYIAQLKTDVEKALVELCKYSLIEFDPYTERYMILNLTKKYIKAVADVEHSSIYYQRWREWIIKFAIENAPQYWYDFISEKIEGEFPNLQEALLISINQTDWDFFLSLIIPVCWYYNYAGLWPDLIEKAELGVQIASDMKNYKVEATLRSHLLGYAYRKKGDFISSFQHIEKAHNIYKYKFNDKAGEMYSIVNYAQVLRKKGTDDSLMESKKQYEMAQSLLNEIDDKDRSFIALQFELGKLYRDSSEWDKAKEKFNTVYTWLLRHPNDPLNQSQLKGAVLSHLALIEFKCDINQSLALSQCNQAIAIFERMRLKVAYGPLYWIKTQILKSLGRIMESDENCKTAIEWFERLGMDRELTEAIDFKKKLHEKFPG